MVNANEDIVAEIHAEMRDSQDLVHFLQPSPLKSGPSRVQAKTTELRANVPKNQTFLKYGGNSQKINSAHIHR